MSIFANPTNPRWKTFLLCILKIHNSLEICQYVGWTLLTTPPPRKPLSHTSILQWNLHHICTGYKKSQFCKKKIFQNVVPFQNGGQITDFNSARHFDFGQLWKNHFPKGIFHWNLAQRRRIWINLHCWNNIFKKLFRFKMVDKTIFYIAQ